MSLTNKKSLHKLAMVFAAFTSFFFKYMDKFTINNPASLDAASGIYFLGRKSAAVLSDRELLPNIGVQAGRLR